MSSVRQTLTVMALAPCFLGSDSYSDFVSGEEQVSFMAGKHCIARLELPADYDHLKLPGNTSHGPLHMHVEMDVRQVREVDESKKSYTLDVVFFLKWKDERLKGQTEKTNCSPVFPYHEKPEFWIPGNTLSAVHRTPHNIVFSFRS